MLISVWVMPLVLVVTAVLLMYVGCYPSEDGLQVVMDVKIHIHMCVSWMLAGAVYGKCLAALLLQQLPAPQQLLCSRCNCMRAILQVMLTGDV